MVKTNNNADTLFHPLNVAAIVLAERQRDADLKEEANAPLVTGGVVRGWENINISSRTTVRGLTRRRRSSRWPSETL